MTEKNSEWADFIRLRQKGLFLFLILILGFLGFRFGAVNPKRIPSEKIGVPPILTIELEGKVQRPGLYVFLKSPTVQQVIRDGGGLSEGQTLSTSEEKMVLIQDATLTVEAGKNKKTSIQQKPLSVKALWILGKPIPLNRTTVEDLDHLPGIGPGLARRIVEYRQANGIFSSLEQLKEVNGLKEKTFEKIKGYLTL